MSFEAYQNINNPEVEDKNPEENREKEIFDSKKYLKDRFEMKDEDAERDLEKVELLKSKDLPEHYKKQYLYPFLKKIQGRSLNLILTHSLLFL